MGKLYKTYVRKDEKEEWRLAFINRHHVVAHRKEEYAKSKGLQVKTEIENEKKVRFI